MASDAEDIRDEALVKRTVAGDRRAFDALVRRHEDRIFALALRMLGDRADALDATQDAFLAAFRQAKNFRFDSAFGTWLYRIAINACKDSLRRKSRLRLSDEEPIENPGTSAGVDETAGRRVDLARALTALSEEYRDALLMHDLGGIPYEDIAARLDIPIGTVKSRISRGRRKLAELLEHGPPAAASKGPI